MSTAAADQPLIGRSVLITGATGGIGQQTARALARSGARVIITGRELDTGEQAAAAIRREFRPDSVTFLRPTTPPSAATRTWPTASARRSPDCTR